jgi:cupin fold WbuC family metalloprotein
MDPLGKKAMSEIPAGMRAESPEVFYRTDSPRLVTAEDIVFLKMAAMESPRLRSRLCLHEGPSDVLHEMLIVHHRSAYVPPHAHKQKGESLHVIEGECTAVFFDPLGEVDRTLELVSWDRSKVDHPYFYRIEPMVFHTLLIRSEWLVFQETAIGPFDPNGTIFVDWAPSKDDAVRGLAWLTEQVRRASR